MARRTSAQSNVQSSIRLYSKGSRHELFERFKEHSGQAVVTPAKERRSKPLIFRLRFANIREAFPTLREEVPCHSI